MAKMLKTAALALIIPGVLATSMPAFADHDNRGWQGRATTAAMTIAAVMIVSPVMAVITSRTIAIPTPGVAMMAVSTAAARMALPAC